MKLSEKERESQLVVEDKDTFLTFIRRLDLSSKEEDFIVKRLQKLCGATFRLRSIFDLFRLLWEAYMENYPQSTRLDQLIPLLAYGYIKDKRVAGKVAAHLNFFLLEPSPLLARVPAWKVVDDFIAELESDAIMARAANVE